MFRPYQSFLIALGLQLILCQPKNFASIEKHLRGIKYLKEIIKFKASVHMNKLTTIEIGKYGKHKHICIPTESFNRIQ